jgi:hypothetical protein
VPDDIGQLVYRTSTPGRATLHHSWGNNMGLADDIRCKVDARVLPRGTPDNVSARRGDGQQCHACDDLISTGQVEYGVDLPGLGTLLFHASCFGLWEAEMLRRGWLKQPVPRG